MNIASIGIDLGKTTFHLVALGERNKVLVRKKFSRATLLTYTANLPAALIGLDIRKMMQGAGDANATRRRLAPMRRVRER